MSRKSKQTATSQQTVESLTENPALPCEGPVFIEVKDKTAEEKEDRNLLRVMPTPPAVPDESIPEAVKEAEDKHMVVAIKSGCYRYGPTRYLFEQGNTYRLETGVAEWFSSNKIVKVNQ